MLSAYDYLIQSEYYAPRGKRRLLELGMLISQKYLNPDDRLIGFIGKAGAGKSLLIRGMFPGLELTNDDNGTYISPLPLMHDAEANFFRNYSYHVDARHESEHYNMEDLSKAVEKALLMGKRVIVEHFELLYPTLKLNAEILIGIGEEVIVTRPDVFGPEPGDIAKVVFETLKYRIMSHTVEDLTMMVLQDMGVTRPEVHSDVKHGFVLEFSHIPSLDLDEVEGRVKKILEDDLPITYYDEGHILVGDRKILCTGPRLHVSSTGEIKNFRLLKDFKWDPINQLYMIAGLVDD
jgi:hypothetical protein